MAAIELSNTTAGTRGFDLGGQSEDWRREDVGSATAIISDGLADRSVESPGGELAT